MPKPVTVRRRPRAWEVAAAAALLALFGCFAVWVWTRTPVVSRAWPSGACVRVDPPWTCAAPPARHVVQWVAPEAE